LRMPTLPASAGGVRSAYWQEVRAILRDACIIKATPAH
jgi:hypothetical protein